MAYRRCKFLCCHERLWIQAPQLDFSQFSCSAISRVWPSSSWLEGRGPRDEGPEPVTSLKEGPSKLSHYSSAYILSNGPEVSHLITQSARDAGNVALFPAVVYLLGISTSKGSKAFDHGN